MSGFDQSSIAVSMPTVVGADAALGGPYKIKPSEAFSGALMTVSGLTGETISVQTSPDGYQGAPANPSFYRTDWQGTSLLYPSARTNLALQSEAMATAPWVVNTGTSTATATTITDTDATAISSRVQIVSVANDSSPYWVSAVVGKNAPNLIAFRVNLSGGTAVGAAIIFDTVSGKWGVLSFYGIPTADRVSVIDLGDEGWRIAVKVTNNSTGNTSCSIFLYPAFATTLAVSGDTAAVVTLTGTASFGKVQLEASDVLTSYIGPTAASTVTVTDYTLSNGVITLAQATNPAVSQRVSTNNGAGDGVTTAFAVSPAGGTPTVSALYKTDTQATVAFEGDSISVQWPFLLNLPTSLIPENYAVAGSTTTDMAARFDVYKANRYVGFAVLGGINDLATDVAIATIQANLTAMWGGAKALGMTVVAMTVMPWKGNATYWTAGRQAVTDALNTWIASEATANGYLLVDTFTLMEDPLNPDYLLPAYDSGDGLHPSAAGKAAIASAVGSVINTLAPRHLLSTVSRTNILTQSNDFANVAWSRVNVTSTPGETDPDGGTTASLLTASATAALQIYSPLAAATSTTMVASVYTKAGTRALARFILRNNTTALNFQSGTFTYATGLVSGPGWVVATMLDGWFRLSFKATTGITAGDNLRLYTGDLGNVVTGGETWRLWKAQIEADRLTPPITTTTAAVAITDYTLVSNTATLSPAPAVGSVITWDGSYAGGLGIGNTLSYDNSVLPSPYFVFATGVDGAQYSYAYDGVWGTLSANSGKGNGIWQVDLRGAQAYRLVKSAGSETATVNMTLKRDALQYTNSAGTWSVT